MGRKAGGTLGWPAYGPPRQVHSMMWSATAGSWPKRECSSRRIGSRSSAVNGASSARVGAGDRVRLAAGRGATGDGLRLARATPSFWHVHGR